ncbi:MAG: SMP-30/gluconolactonase/LRE family protein [Planctomycetota bacterium]|nr:SMP-30/gluconolactonase/LRE family protein [Planctomycetota bacterium]
MNRNFLIFLSGSITITGSPTFALLSADERYVTLPGKSVGNGLRFDRDGFLFVADYPEYNVLRTDPKTKAITVFAHQPKMNQPNDPAITKDGVLYASDQNWEKGTGQIWRIDRDGSTHLVAADMGTTNGIDVSPDGKTLYVNESAQRNAWAFQITENGALSEKKLITKDTPSCVVWTGATSRIECDHARSVVTARL